MIKFLNIFLLITLLSTGSSFASFLAPTSCEDVPKEILTEQADVVITGYIKDKKCKCTASGYSLKCIQKIEVTQPYKNGRVGDNFRVYYNVILDYGCDRKEEKIISSFLKDNKPRLYFLDKKLFGYKEIPKKQCTYK